MTGEQRPLDDVGRLVIPAAIRRAAGFEPGDVISITLAESGIVTLQKASNEGDDIPSLIARLRDAMAAQNTSVDEVIDLLTEER